MLRHLFFYDPVLLCAANLGLSLSGLSWDGSGSGSYDPFDGTEYVQEVTFSVTHDSGDATDFFITFSKGGASDYNRRVTLVGDTLDYQIYDTATETHILKGINDAVSSNDVINGVILSEDTSPKQLKYYIAMSPQNIASPGSYDDTFTVKVFEGLFGSTTTPDATANITFTVSNPSTIQMSMVDSGQGFDEFDTAQSMDFDTLTQNEELGFDIRVRSNASYSLTMETDNQGVLKHQDVGVTDTISYTVKVDAIEKDLTGAQPVEVSTGSGQTTIDGDVHAILVNISGEVNNKVAGSYLDSISTTVTTTE